MEKHEVVGIIGTVIVAFILLGPGSIAYGSGYALAEQSVKNMGTAYAGAGTDTNDAGSIFYNPAAMAFMERNAAVLGVSMISFSDKFKDRGSTDAFGSPLTGGDGGQGGTTCVVPNLYCVQRLTDTVKLGLGINSPYGLATMYDADWKGRYHAVKSQLTSVEISPSVAVKVIDCLTAGASLNVQYIDAELTNAIDFGTILAAAGTMPQTLDGFARLKGDDWGVGYSVGLLCELASDTRVGLSYRSKIDHTLKGNVDFDVPATARTILNATGMTDSFVDTNAHADLTTPETVSLGLYQVVSDSLAVVADVTWTRWSRFKELRVEFASGQPDGVTEERWTDTLCYALGLQYRLDPGWTFRIGTAYDESPVKTSYRTPRLPDNDRIWLALGAGYRFSEDLSVDVGYAHQFTPESDSNLTNQPANGYLIGEYTASGDTYGVQVSMRY